MKDAIEELWHYERPDVAKMLLDAFWNSGNNKVVMFERRRRGKTDLLLYDVIPAAEAAGYRPVYVNIWHNSADPAGHLVAELSAALSEKTIAERVADWGRSPVEKIKIAGELYGAKGELELGLGKDEKRAAASTLAALKEAADQLAARRRRVLLMIDEVQTLAATAHLELVRALRTILEVHKDKIHAIFTGSSREGLMQLFAAKDAPFFRSSTSFRLPEMDRGFVQHLLGVFNNITRLQVDETEAMQVFLAVHRSPYHFRGVVSQAVQSREPNITKALKTYRQRLPEHEGYVASWQALTPGEKVLLLVIANGISSIFSKAAAAETAKLTGGDPLKKSAVQRAMRGLLSKQLVTKSNPTPLESDRSNYTVEDEEMGEWLRGDAWTLPGSFSIEHED